MGKNIQLYLNTSAVVREDWNTNPFFVGGSMPIGHAAPHDKIMENTV